MGMDPDTDVRTMPSDQRRAIIIRVEESLSDQNMSRETQRQLKSCARVRVNRRNCPNTVAEFKAYSYPRKRRLNMNYIEKPRGWMDHAMDAYGYFLWTKKRFAFEVDPTGFDYLSIEQLPPDDDEPAGLSRPGRNPYLIPAQASPGFDNLGRTRMFWDEMRSATERSRTEPRSYMGLSG
jgi:hypothetical protein